MNNPTGKAYFCPKCNSPSLTIPTLVGGQATCSACSWKGVKEDLLVHYFEHDLGSDTAVAEALARDFKKLMGEHVAKPLATLLYKWGFFRGAPTPTELTRYIVAMAGASMKALIEERNKMELERVHNGN